MFDIIGILKNFGEMSEKIISNLGGYVMGLAYFLALIDLSLYLISSIYNKNGNLIFGVLKKLGIYAVINYVLINYTKLVFGTLFGSAIQIANIATGIGNSAYLEYDLGGLVNTCMSFIFHLSSAAGIGLSAIDFFGVESIPTGIIIMGIGIIGLITMTLLEIVLAFIEFYLIGAFAFILIPFLFWSKTKDIGMKAFMALISQAIKIMLIVTVLNMSTSTFMMSTNTLKKLTFSNVGLYLMSSMFFFFLIKKVPTFVVALASGTLSDASSMLAGGGAVASNLARSGGSRVKGNISSALRAKGSSVGNLTNLDAYKKATSNAGTSNRST